MASPLSLKTEHLAEVKASIPATDFVDAQFDRDRGVPTANALILLSTPRSGSTLLCELLRVNDVCLAHEYFQPGQYLPLLAERWGCISGGALNEAKYVASLRRYRTFSNGWLGINLHGSHLPVFARMAPLLAGVRLHYVHLIRRDLIPQAVSYHIAAETRQWSSEFRARREVDYDFNRIRSRLLRIQHQNVLISAYLRSEGVAHSTLWYEDLVADPAATLRRVPGVPAVAELSTQSNLQRQAGDRSNEWVRRFAAEYVAAANGVEAAPRRAPLFHHLRRLLRAR